MQGDDTQPHIRPPAGWVAYSDDPAVLHDGTQLRRLLALRCRPKYFRWPPVFDRQLMADLHGQERPREPHYASMELYNGRLTLYNDNHHHLVVRQNTYPTNHAPVYPVGLRTQNLIFGII